MGILNRFTTIIEANVNDLLDRAEDPSKMVDQYLIDLADSLAKVKQETAGVMAEEKRCARLVEENEGEAARMEALAKKALAAGNEGDARKFLGKKQQLDTERAELVKAADAAAANADKMRQMHDKLVGDIEQLKSRRDTIKAKAAVAKTKETVNKISSGSDKGAGVIDAIDRMEAKVDRKLDTADAVAELSSTPADSVEALSAKYDSAADEGAVDDALARLKESMGLTDEKGE